MKYREVYKMKKFNDWLNENEMLVEMARIGYADNLEIYVLTDDPGYIPHIHIRDRETKGKVFTNIDCPFIEQHSLIDFIRMLDECFMQGNYS